MRDKDNGLRNVLITALVSLSIVFAWCSALTSVSIPSSLYSIGPWAFEDCSNITILTISMTTLPLFTSCGFNSSTKYEHIYVPSNLVDTYKAADGWKTYATIIEAIPA